MNGISAFLVELEDRGKGLGQAPGSLTRPCTFVPAWIREYCTDYRETVIALRGRYYHGGPGR